MISSHLSGMWTTLAPALGNHLWQSTLFAVTVGLLTLVLWKYHARVRYCLWLAASVKFLIPFSLLVGIGSYLPWLHRAEGTNPGFYVAIEEVSQPFTQPTMPMIPRGIDSIGPIHLLPAVLAAVWLSGFLVVIFQWYFRWRRIAQAIRKAVPCHERLAAQALHGLQRAGGIGSATARMFS